MIENGQLYRNMGYRADYEDYSPTLNAMFASVNLVKSPLPRSKQGNTMLLVFHDVFSKWVELIPLRKATAAQAQQAFRERILGRVGIPRKFVCDNGTQFTSWVLKDYFTKLGVEIQYTAPYCPQENPTEKTNRTVKTLISQLSEGDQSSCDNLLPEISLAINSNITDSTG
ncbi:uncharacterized protein LOC128253440 [Drosophila gunungcola]|uniref:uncharacterized protein LOC128253440 n=1 Tax=Drosophila gunungcola TaxID=103775 RepID=UPI0022E81D74|nr:uncharacterized protein LOC128253440 [Drosophila gunungcola]